MVTTKDREYWERIWSYKDHGKSWEAVYEREYPPGFRWLYESFGSNGRMLEVQSVIGRIQLRRMEDWSAARTRHAEAIRSACRPHSVVRVPAFRCNEIQCHGDCATAVGCAHAYYRFYAYVEESQIGSDWSRDRIIAEINRAGVPCYHGSCPEVYLEAAFDGTGWRPAERLPVARELGETSLMFLVHPTLTDEEISRTCQVVDKVFHLASKR